MVVCPRSRQRVPSIDDIFCSSCGTSCLAFVLMIFAISGPIMIDESRWKSEFDDEAKNTWVAGDCLIVEHSKITKVTKGSGKQKGTWYQVKIFVDRLAERHGAGDSVVIQNVSLPVRPAYKYPHMSRSGASRRFESKEQAKSFKASNFLGRERTCYWDPSRPRRVAMNNVGGDWAPVRWGIVLTVIGWLGPCFLFFCWGCLSVSQTVEEEVASNSPSQPAPSSSFQLARAHSFQRARSVARAPFERARSFARGTPEALPPHIGPSSFSAGEEIQINYKGTWCKGVVQGHSDDRYYTVAYTDGSGFVEPYVAASRLRRAQLQANSHPTRSSLDDARDGDDVAGVERVNVSIDDATTDEVDAPSCVQC